MAQLTNKIEISLEELEESLGVSKLPSFVNSSEMEFFEGAKKVASEALSNKNKRVIFISGPTSSGKTTFTSILSKQLVESGIKAAYLSLDDYYAVKELTFDSEGRPDYETKDTLNLDQVAIDINLILKGQSVITPRFNFQTRMSEKRDLSEAICLGNDGILIVEGLHGIANEISGTVPSELCTKIFIVPYGDVFADNRVFDGDEIRLLRRIVRDSRHRNAKALSTVDYWPMIEKSEEAYYNDYLKRADYHINSFLKYEVLVTAPLALHEINLSLQMVDNGTIGSNVFMEKSYTKKPFANLSAALNRCQKLKVKLERIPVIDPSRVPANSILNEFIGIN